MSYKVVILKAKPQALKQAEQFLRNRQWQIITTTNLRDAIAAVIQKQPEFVLIAADHPNRKARVLPKLIGQAFPVKVVGFVEASTNASMAILQEMGLEYNVFPPVSGPAIERTILKIKKDEEKKELDRQRAIENGTYMPESSGDTMSVTGDNFSSAREMLARLANGDEAQDDANVIGGAGTANASGVGASAGSGSDADISGIAGDGSSAAGSLAGGSANFEGSPGYLPNQGSDSESGSPHFQKGVGMGQAPGFGDQAGSNTDQNGNFIPPGADEHGSGYTGGEGQGFGKGGSADGGAPGDSQPGWGPAGDAKNSGRDRAGADSSATNPFGDENDDFNNPYASSWDTLGEKPRPAATEDPNYEGGPSSRKRKDAPIMESGPIARKARKQPTYKQDPSHYPDRESVIVKGTQEALEKSVLVADGEQPFDEVKSATNVACITISSPRFSGYLVAALGADRQIDEEFLKTVQDRLFSFLRANGENIGDDDGMNLKLEQVDFEEWAIAQANFLRKSIHGTNEIAMAFFPSQETETKLEQSVAENMLQLGIDELRDDVPVEFDLYIYLPSNKKYLLYTPQGRKLFGAQRGRLRNKGVTHMHLRKDSASQVKRYRAQVYLNEMIGSFKRGGGKKAA